MAEKVYKDALPCGILTTRSGKEYWLLKPEPVVRDSWQHDHQQRFLVVPYIEIGLQDFNDEKGMQLVYAYARHLITTDPDIEYRYETTTIKVWDLQEWDAVEKSPNPELDNYSYLDDLAYMEALGADLDE